MPIEQHKLAKKTMTYRFKFPSSWISGFLKQTGIGRTITLPIPSSELSLQ
jgi:hypothetical protein